MSGGSVIAGLYASENKSFELFDERVVALLRSGLHADILKRLLRPALATRILATNLIARPAAFVSRILRVQPPLRRWASRSDALEEVLRSHYGDVKLADVARPNLDVVLNACELRTGTAFRFGNRRSGSWRTGEIVGNNVTVAHAVACSAAYPIFLPAFDRFYDFERRKGVRKRQRVIITDGGVFDNLATTCVEPGRDSAYSLHVYEPDYFLDQPADFWVGTSRGLPEYRSAKRLFYVVYYSELAIFDAEVKENFSHVADLLFLYRNHAWDRGSTPLASSSTIGLSPQTTVRVGTWSLRVKQTLELLDESYRKTMQYMFNSFLASEEGSWRWYDDLSHAAEKQQEKILTRLTGKVERVREDTAVVSLEDEAGIERHATCDLEVLTARGIGDGDRFRCLVIRRDGSTSVEFERREADTLSQDELERFYRKVDEQLGDEGL